MYYSKIYKTSILDGPGCRVSLYVSGCRNKCEGCHNPESWNFKFGKKFDKKTLDYILKLLERPYIAGFTLCGGEVFEEENQKICYRILKKIKKKFPNKNIWCWTGYQLHDLLKKGKKHTIYTNKMLSYIDVLVDGPFILSKRDISDNNRWRGSTNQRVINLKATLLNKKLILVDNIPNNM